MTNKLEIHIIELPKVANDSESQEELVDWLTFLENPESERVREKMKENEELKEAVEKIHTMSEDEYMQRMADLREKAIRDEKARIDYALEKGEKKAKLEDAKKMLEEKIPLEVIIRVTGLTEEEIMN